MKTNLTLSALVFAVSLAPATFANGTQEQKPASFAEVAASTAAAVTHTAAQASPVLSVARSVLERVDAEARANLLESLRTNGVQILQAIAPVLVDAGTESKNRVLPTR